MHENSQKFGISLLVSNVGRDRVDPRYVVASIEKSLLPILMLAHLFVSDFIEELRDIVTVMRVKLNMNLV